MASYERFKVTDLRASARAYAATGGKTYASTGDSTLEQVPTTTETLLQVALRDYYLLPEAAEAKGVSRVTIWRWIRDGKLSCERIGREVLIERNALHAL